MKRLIITVTVVTAPLGGSVSLGVHAVERARPAVVAEHLVQQAVAAERVGFDGVTVSEHHGDFPGYVPQPMQVATWILESTRRVWSGPAPLLLGLRNAALVAEELAWAHARHPGRVVAAFAPGYAADDFALVGASFDGRVRAMREGLSTLCAALRGCSPLQTDPAIADAVGQIPLLAAASVASTARRAALEGVGLLLPGATAPSRAAELAAAHREGGGRGPVVAIVRVWVGEPPVGDDAMVRRMAGAGAPGASEGALRQGPVCGDLQRVVAEVAAFCQVSTADAVNLRVHSSGASAAAVLEQIEIVGQHVVPAARSVLAARGRCAIGGSGTR